MVDMAPTASAGATGPGLKRRPFVTRKGRTLNLTTFGFGTAPLGNLYKALDEPTAQATLAAAWDAGMRFFDTAPLYGLGLAETRLNTFLRGRDRADYTVATKVGRLLEPCRPEERTAIGKFFETPARREIYDYSYDGVMRSVEFSLERLGLDRVEILFAHDLDVFNHKSQAALDGKLAEFMAGGYRALVRLRETGVIDAFGAGVNEWPVTQWLIERGDFDIFLLAGRYTLLEQQSLESLLPLCVARGVGLVIGGPFNSGILATGPKPGAYYNYDIAPVEILERVGRIEAICRAHGVPLADAALQFPLKHPAVVSVIPGGQSADEVRRNVASLNTVIPDALWADLKAAGLVRPDAPT